MVLETTQSRDQSHIYKPSKKATPKDKLWFSVVFELLSINLASKLAIRLLNL